LIVEVATREDRGKVKLAALIGNVNVSVIISLRSVRDTSVVAARMKGMRGDNIKSIREDDTTTTRSLMRIERLKKVRWTSDSVAGIVVGMIAMIEDLAGDVMMLSGTADQIGQMIEVIENLRDWEVETLNPEMREEAEDISRILDVNMTDDVMIMRI
jgi:hypothetical protein